MSRGEKRNLMEARSRPSLCCGVHRRSRRRANNQGQTLPMDWVGLQAEGEAGGEAEAGPGAGAGDEAGAADAQPLLVASRWQGWVLVCEASGSMPLGGGSLTCLLEAPTTVVRFRLVWCILTMRT